MRSPFQALRPEKRRNKASLQEEKKEEDTESKTKEDQTDTTLKDDKSGGNGICVKRDKSSLFSSVVNAELSRIELSRHMDQPLPRGIRVVVACRRNSEPPFYISGLSQPLETSSLVPPLSPDLVLQTTVKLVAKWNRGSDATKHDSSIKIECNLSDSSTEEALSDNVEFVVGLVNSGDDTQETLPALPIGHSTVQFPASKENRGGIVELNLGIVKDLDAYPIFHVPNPSFKSCSSSLNNRVHDKKADLNSFDFFLQDSDEDTQTSEEDILQYFSFEKATITLYIDHQSQKDADSLIQSMPDAGMASANTNASVTSGQSLGSRSNHSGRKLFPSHKESEACTKKISQTSTNGVTSPSSLQMSRKEIVRASSFSGIPLDSESSKRETQLEVPFKSLRSMSIVPSPKSTTKTDKKDDAGAAGKKDIRKKSKKLPRKVSESSTKRSKQNGSSITLPEKEEIKRAATKTNASSPRHSRKSLEKHKSSLQASANQNKGSDGCVTEVEAAELAAVPDFGYSQEIEAENLEVELEVEMSLDQFMGSSTAALQDDASILESENDDNTRGDYTFRTDAETKALSVARMRNSSLLHQTHPALANALGKMACGSPMLDKLRPTETFDMVTIGSDMDEMTNVPQIESVVYDSCGAKSAVDTFEQVLFGRESPMTTMEDTTYFSRYRES